MNSSTTYTCLFSVTCQPESQLHPWAQAIANRVSEPIAKATSLNALANMDMSCLGAAIAEGLTPLAKAMLDNTKKKHQLYIEPQPRAWEYVYSHALGWGSM